MMAAKVQYRSWLLRVTAWDGMLPAFVVVVPSIVELLLPNHRGAIEFTAVTLPIVAFFTRLVVGQRHIDSNNCSAAFRLIQFWVFFLGVFPLVLIDGALVLSHVMPKGVFTREDSLFFAVLYSVYLVAMIIAMYPGRAESFREETACTP
jgi:hypothetical protein